MLTSDHPTVAVIVAAYNKEKYIREALDSILAQTYPATRILVCDDASTDGTADIIRAYEAEHPGLVEGVYNPRNMGISGNLNSGISRVREDYLACIAADDMWHPDKLLFEVQRLAEVPDARWVYSECWRTDAEGKVLGPITSPFQGAEGNIAYLVLRFQMIIRNFLVETRLIQSLGGFDESLVVCEDWDMVARLAASAPAAWTSERTVYYRKHGEGLWSSDPELRYRYLKLAHDKNVGLLDSLTEEQRRSVERNLKSSRAVFIKEAVDLAMQKGNYREAARYWVIASAAAHRPVVPSRLRAQLKRVLPGHVRSVMRSVVR